MGEGAEDAHISCGGDVVLWRSKSIGPMDTFSMNTFLLKLLTKKRLMNHNRIFISYLESKLAQSMGGRLWSIAWSEGILARGITG